MSRFVIDRYTIIKIINTFEEEYKLTPIDNNRQMYYFVYDIVEFIDYELKLFTSSSKLSQIAKLSYNTLMYNNTGNVIGNITVKNIVNIIIDIFVDYV